jgi:ATP-dependent RNA helicase RhlE
MAIAQTGTGKTAAFALPMLQTLHGRRPQRPEQIRGLILTPTRELALQIEASLRAYGKHLPLRTAVLVGGVSPGPQIRALEQGPDILVATPGRLLDLLRQGRVRLDRVAMVVLDEADRMLDMGFVRDVRRIVAEVPVSRQTMFFAATMSKEIAELADALLTDPVKVTVTPPASVSEKIAQKVLFVDRTNKRELLTDILKDEVIRRALVFTRTKHRADRIARHLSSRGISADAIHSNKGQIARQRALSAFDRGRIRVLVATDIVSRGIQVDGISHVINYELPEDPESYVHRIGRTARAGACGTALSFCDADEITMLRGIEKLANCTLVEVDGHRFHSVTASAARGRRAEPPPSRPGSRGSLRRGRRSGRPARAR